jgi:hypothetical protein
MSHTSKFRIKGTEYTVIHNGDWSGNAEIRWEQPIHGEPSRHVAVSIPGELLIAVGRQATLQEVAGLVEDLMGKVAPPIQDDPPRTVTITVNGRKVKAAVYASYADIVRIAFPQAREGAILSVVYSHGPSDNREGILAPGDRVGVCEGMHFNAADTSNA